MRADPVTVQCSLKTPGLGLAHPKACVPGLCKKTLAAMISGPLLFIVLTQCTLFKAYCEEFL
jgi:hypothetical protein